VIEVEEPHREIEDRDIRNPVDMRFMHFGIARSETPIGDKTTVMGIVVICARSLARRANT
jgi:hypothetical protein